MNDGFSFDSANRAFRIIPVLRVYITDDCRQNMKPKLAQVPEQLEIIWNAYLVAARHL